MEITYSFDKKGFLIVHIADNGVGMESLQLKNLFMLNQTLSTKGTSGETGTGLGLVLCKEFIERNGGEIWAESEPSSWGSASAWRPPAP